MEHILVSEMQDNHLQLIDEEGLVMEVPIVGAFKVDGKYYVVVFIEPHEKAQDGELVMFRIEKEGDKEYIQIITDRSEWDIASSTWTKIANKAVYDGVTPVGGEY